MPVPTTRDELKEQILSVFKEAHSGDDELQIDEESVLLESGIDSLGFAIIVTRLDEELGYDPFTLSSEAYYPNTLREFVDFYFQNAPK